MLRTFLLSLLLFCFAKAYSQDGYIVLKKRQKSEQRFWKDGHFTFQTNDRQWMTGIITRITADSFYFSKEIIQYRSMGADTFHISGFRFSLNDVSTVPPKKAEIVYRDDQVWVVLGNEKFVWIRDGLIFQLGSAGYAGLNTINHLIHNDPPFAKDNLKTLGICGAVFLAATLLHKNFDPYIHLGKKYHLECVLVGAPKK